MKARARCWLWGLLWLLPGLLQAAVPDPLQPWQQWALRDQPQWACPSNFSDYQQRQCQWPGILHLQATASGLHFQQHWKIYAATRVPLPGGEGYWPETVLVNAVPGLILQQDERPGLWLEPGDYDLAGFIPWQQIPEFLRVPATTALIDLTLRGAPVAQPKLDQAGRLWLVAGADQGPEPELPAEDKLTVRVHRHLVDSLPFVMETRVDLEVAGKTREVLLGKLLFDGFTPRTLHSPLPARLDNDGRLRIQLRAGRWQVRLQAHRLASVTRVFFETSDEGFWPQEEVWVFEPRPALRQVRVEGVDSIDPAQTALPREWQQWPAYRLQQGQVMTLHLLRRGDPQPAPNQLQVQRDLWLDFSGAGMTVQDRIGGTMNRDWRLNVDPRMVLGRLTLNDEPQVITRSDGQQGVEVRSARLQAEAVSRLPLKPGTHKQRLPAVGWQHNAESLQATLHLPPGWRLLMTAGVDHADNTWLGSWSVWDVFVVLITVAAVWRLRGLLAALVCGVALLLIYPEANEFLYLLLNVILVLTILALLPPGRLRGGLQLYAALASLVLSLWLLGFMVEQARLGLYPQLQQPWHRLGDRAATAPPVLQDSGGLSMAADMATEAVAKYRSAAPQAPSEPQRLEQRDPNLAAQTGPGVPHWRWQQARLHWSGPVTAGETVILWLLKPTENRILSWSRVVLCVLVVITLLGLRRRNRQWHWCGGRGLTTSALTLLAFLLLPGMPEARAEFPPAAMLEDLARQQQAARDCTPGCVSVVKSRFQIEGQRATLTMTVHARQAVFWPLPESRQQWQLDAVLLDGAPHVVSQQPDQTLQVLVPAGDHQLVLSGSLRRQTPFQLTFPLALHNLELHPGAFRVRGFEAGRMVSNTLHFQPPAAVAAAGPEAGGSQWRPDPVAPLVQVRRTLRLGLNWYLETQVQRLAPATGGISLDIPLLAGESVTSQDMQVADGAVKLNLAPGQQAQTWYSALEKTSLLTLEAAATTHWVEYWSLEVSPLWRLQWEGLAPVKDASGIGRWQPRWRPYPGESLKLVITRPEAVAGTTKTLQRVEQTWQPGARESNASLRLQVSTSKGTEQRIELPDSARVKAVRVDDKPLAVDEGNPKLIIPINPGSHRLDIEWRQPSNSGWRDHSPVVGLGDDYVNHSLQVSVLRDRWVLWVGGPPVGPAILFWGVALVLVLLGLVLGQIRRLPLRGWHWILLLLGLCTGWLESIPVVVAWFFLLQLRRSQWARGLGRLRFNGLQVLIVLATVVTFAVLLAAIPQGLIGSPDMGIVGNGSSQFQLHWFVDRGAGELASGWYLALPLWVYRALMLAWSLWLALYMLRWLKWGWESFTLDGHWRHRAGDPSQPADRATSETP